MKAICFYFQIHQPFRLKHYRFFDIGNDHYYYDDFADDDIITRIAQRSYLPANEVLLEYWKRPGKWADAKKVEARFKRFRAKIAGAMKGAKVNPCIRLLVDKFPGDGRHRAAIALYNEDGTRVGTLWSSKGPNDFGVANPQGLLVRRGAFKDTVAAYLKGLVNTKSELPLGLPRALDTAKSPKRKGAQKPEPVTPAEVQDATPIAERKGWTNYELLDELNKRVYEESCAYWDAHDGKIPRRHRKSRRTRV